MNPRSFTEALQWIDTYRRDLEGAQDDPWSYGAPVESKLNYDRAMEYLRTRHSMILLAKEALTVGNPGLAYRSLVSHDDS